MNYSNHFPQRNKGGCVISGGVGDGLVVLFWNGIKLNVAKNLAVWIPASHHERFIRELQSNVYRTDCLSHCSHINQSPVCCINRINNCLSTTASMSCPLSYQCLLMENQWKEKEIKPDQVKELATSQEIKTDVSSSDSSEDEEEVANEKLNSTQSDLVSRSVNTEISYLKKTHTQQQSRPAWRYWRRGSPEPHHKKPGTSLPNHEPSLASSVEPKIPKSI